MILLVFSSIAYLAKSPVNVVFALNADNFEVIANDQTWSTSGGNTIDSSTANIVIRSEISLTSLECQLERSSGAVVEGFKSCQNGSSRIGTVTYNDLIGDYTFVLRGSPFDTDELRYEFTANTGTSTDNTPNPNTEIVPQTIAKSEVTIANGKPPWTGCPSAADKQNTVIPGFLHEIRYESLGTAKLKNVLEADGDITLEVQANFVNGLVSGDISNSGTTKFDIHSMHTECEYSAPKSSFSPETGTVPGTSPVTENLKLSNPPFVTCDKNDESAKYEIDTTVDPSPDTDEKIKSLNLDGNQETKIVITQFFKKKTGELGEPWYSGELIIDGGKTKIDLLLKGSDIHTTCLENFIA